ncbi:MAG: TonB-dependent receptor [Bryobacteraceae bacterium]|nr:TonB-dependent receptor [Bryobacteraceae bacterium]MDW8379153.1 TonB-dependent receptor [Bryobacterales bacterium]
MITDRTGASIPNVTIEVVHTATNVRTETISTGTGAYRLVGLPIGIYDLIAKANGFSTYIQRGIQIQTNQTATIDITLSVGALTESVTVEGGVPLIQTESADVGMVVEAKQFLDLPLALGGGIRNPSTFIKLSPGVAPTGTWTKSISGGGGFQDQVYYDGIALSRGDLSNDAEVNPSVDAIAEFKLITNNYSAEYAHAMGGVTSFTMKSGTNQLHGTGFHFLRNEKLDARGFFPAVRAPSKQNEWGGTLGGPVLIPKLYNGKDKTFWFFSFDQFYRRGGALGGLNTLPTARMQAGDFGELNRLIYDPASSTSTAQRTPFPANRIPVSRWSAVSSKMVPYIPDPELPGLANNSIAPLASPTADERTTGFKINHLFSAKHRASGMYNDTFRPSIKSPGPSRLIPVGGIKETLILNYNLQKVRTNVLHINIDSNLSPTVLNHIGLGYSRFRNPNFSLGFNQGWTQPDGGKLGLRGLQFDLSPTVLFDTEGYTRFGDDIASDNYFHTFTVLDTVTVIRGNHTLKLGGEVQRHRDNYRNFGNGGGTFRYRRETTGLPGVANSGDAFASFLLGETYSASAFFRDSLPGGRYTVYGFFIDDTWKLTSRLTLTLGFRWEPVTPHSDPVGRISYMDPTLPNAAAGNLLGAMRFGGSPGNGNRYLNMLWHNYAPRFGLAFRLTNRTVLRGGAGIFNSNYINQGLGLPAFGYATTASFVSADGGTTAAFNWDGGFPQNFRRPPVKDPVAANGQSVTAVYPTEYQLPYKLQWNFLIEHQFADDLSMSFGYVASVGRHLYNAQALNELPDQYKSLPVSLLTANINSETARAAGFREPFPGFAALYGAAARVNQALRAFPQFQGVTIYGSTYGNSNYQSFQYKLDKRYGRGLSGTVAYTWSKFLTDAAMFDGNPAQQTAYFREKSYHPSDYPHVFTFSLNYDLPIGNGRRWKPKNTVVNQLAGGWNIAVVNSYTSGGRLFITTSNTLPWFNLGLRPDYVSGPIRSNISMAEYDPNDPRRNAYLLRSAFATPAPGRLGTAPRALEERGPMRLDESLALLKNTKITERLTHQFRVEMQNPLNRVVFGNPIMDFTSAAFGRISGTQIEPRNIQFGMKLIF